MPEARAAERPEFANELGDHARRISVAHQREQVLHVADGSLGRRRAAASTARLLEWLRELSGDARAPVDDRIGFGGPLRDLEVQLRDRGAQLAGDRAFAVTILRELGERAFAVVA